MRKRQIDFTGELGVLAALHRLDEIPKGGTVRQKGRPSRR